MCEHSDNESMITKTINMTISQKIYKIISISQYSSQHRYNKVHTSHKKIISFLQAHHKSFKNHVHMADSTYLRFYKLSPNNTTNDIR
jgi:hypothetical protein